MKFRLKNRSSTKCNICNRNVIFNISSLSVCKHCFHEECLQKFIAEKAVNKYCPCPVKRCMNVFTDFVLQKSPKDRFRDIILLEENDKPNHCPICLEELSHPFVMSAECGHLFCKTCLFRHLKKKFCCPIDRIPIKEVYSYEEVGSLPKLAFTLPKEIIVCAACSGMTYPCNLCYCIRCNKPLHQHCDLHPCLKGEWKRRKYFLNPPEVNLRISFTSRPHRYFY